MTQVIHSITEWQKIRKSFLPHQQVGYVPTMGNLHEGHASLLNRARENDISALTIFINPTQFNDQNDFNNYPKTFEQDLDIAKQCKVDYLLIPNAADIYVDNYQYKITENQISHLLEGKQRPGHFDGVLTVLMKLFSLIKPHRVYFGEKDYQQLLLVKGLCEAFFLDITVIGCPTIRLPSGLPFSSRNNLLNTNERELADKFTAQLTASRDPQTIKRQLDKLGFSVEYIEQWQNRLFGAVRVGKVRLIDNIPLDEHV